jgi:hypothetical protein
MLTATDITTSAGNMFESVDEDGEFLRIDVDRGVASIGDYAMVGEENPTGIMSACHFDLHAMKMLRVWLDAAIAERELQLKEDAE